MQRKKGKMMKTISLKGKLIVAFLFAGLLPMLSVGIYSYQESSKVLKDEALQKLVAVRQVKEEAIKRYFEGIKNQVVTFSHNVMIEDAMEAFNKSFASYTQDQNLTDSDISAYKSKLVDFYKNQFEKKYKDENGVGIDSTAFLEKLTPNELALQYHYIANNPNPLGQKEALDFATDESNYSKNHAKYHPPIREYLEKFGYYDVFLVDIKTGDIVYSVYKELDFGTSLMKGPYSQTKFAKAFMQAREVTDKSTAIIVDYERYTPSYGAPAFFIASPVWKDGKKIGVAMFQMPIDRLNHIMGERAGLGETGETFIVGHDYLMRSDSYLKNKTHNVVSSFKKPENGKIESKEVKQALAGESGASFGIDYLDQDSIIAFTPFELNQHKWALITKIHTKEALQSIQALKNTLLIMVAISILGVFIFAIFMSNIVAKSLSQSVGAIAAKLRDTAKKVNKSSEDLTVNCTELSDAATTQAASVQETVSSLDEISSMIQKNADAASNSSNVSSESNDNALRGKRRVEAMIHSIEDISKSNDDIMQAIEKSNESISNIINVISDIGEKTKVINDIVFQTKLLSFNASVEAARAGEHGKGFSVVAEEVGNLASMSGKASLEITEMLDKSIKQVTDIVETTKKTVEELVKVGKEKVESGTQTAKECGDALDTILQNVGNVNDMVNEIAVASSEQSTGVQEVTKAMQQLDRTTHQNTTVAQQSTIMANELKTQAVVLDNAVSELISVIDGRKKNNEEPKGKQGQKMQENVLPLNQKKEQLKKVKNAKKEVKVAGLDTTVPTYDDSRFEDL